MLQKAHHNKNPCEVLVNSGEGAGRGVPSESEHIRCPLTCALRRARNAVWGIHPHESYGGFR
jgi:hypothetical protein